VLASFSNVASNAAINGNQVFGPYGYHQGTINTTKGFTGQYNDSLTGLDYYNSRYYDQVAGVFLSADVKQGNMQGMNPYAYVSGNPETKTDPTGQMLIDGGIGNACMQHAKVRLQEALAETMDLARQYTFLPTCL